MSSRQQNGPPPGHDMVSAEKYRYALQNFRIAHEQVERQRLQLEEQERQVAALRRRIAVLEGGESLNAHLNLNERSSVDDFSIRNAAGKLDRLINRWAVDVVHAPPSPLKNIYDSAIHDIGGGGHELDQPSTAVVAYMLRHAFAETISENIINSLIVTNSPETNEQLTRIHSHIFARDPTVASVWRRQTFSAAVEAFTPDMSDYILSEGIPTLSKLLRAPPPSDQTQPATNAVALEALLDGAYNLSRMLHASRAGAGPMADAFYRAYVPELGSALDPAQMELFKKCRRIDEGKPDRMGACVFPGLVKVSRASTEDAPPGSTRLSDSTTQTVMRRALVICECALGLDHETRSRTHPSSSSPSIPPPPNAPPPPAGPLPAPPGSHREPSESSSPPHPPSATIAFPSPSIPILSVPSTYAESTYETDDPPIPYPGPPEDRENAQGFQPLHLNLSGDLENMRIQ